MFGVKENKCLEENGAVSVLWDDGKGSNGFKMLQTKIGNTIFVCGFGRLQKETQYDDADQRYKYPLTYKARRDSEAVALRGDGGGVDGKEVSANILINTYYNTLEIVKPGGGSMLGIPVNFMIMYEAEADE